jgi:hypothetical protein
MPMNSKNVVGFGKIAKEMIMLFLFLFIHYAMKICGGVEVQLHAFST